MSVPAGPDSPGGDDLVVAALVARRFYLDQHTHTRIAADLDLSRFKVARLIEAARQAGIVEITIHAPGGVNGELGERVRQRLGLRNAVVVNVPEADDAVVRRRLGVVTAALLEETLTPQDVLGLGWSRAVLTAADRLTQLPACEIVQLSGALAHPDVTVNLVDAVDRLARLTGRPGHAFYAPMFVSDPATARAMVRQPEVAAAYGRFDAVTVAVVGIGSWVPPHSTLHDTVSGRERADLLAGGALADLSGVFIDAAGHGLEIPSRRQVVGITAAQLQAVPQVVGIAYGREKAAAVRAACTAGYVTTLVTTAGLAREILDVV